MRLRRLRRAVQLRLELVVGLLGPAGGRAGDSVLDDGGLALEVGDRLHELQLEDRRRLQPLDLLRQQVDRVRWLLDPEVVQLRGQRLQAPLLQPLEQVDPADGRDQGDLARHGDPAQAVDLVRMQRHCAGAHEQN